MLLQRNKKMADREQDQVQIDKVPAPDLNSMLQKQMWIRIRVQAKANLYNGIISRTE